MAGLSIKITFANSMFKIGSKQNLRIIITEKVENFAEQLYLNEVG